MPSVSSTTFLAGEWAGEVVTECEGVDSLLSIVSAGESMDFLEKVGESHGDSLKLMGRFAVRGVAGSDREGWNEARMSRVSCSKSCSVRDIGREECASVCVCCVRGVCASPCEGVGEVDRSLLRLIRSLLTLDFLFCFLGAISGLLAGRRGCIASAFLNDSHRLGFLATALQK